MEHSGMMDWCNNVHSCDIINQRGEEPMRPLDNIVLLTRNKQNRQILVRRGLPEGSSYQDFLKRIRIGDPDSSGPSRPDSSTPSTTGITRHEW